MKKRLIALMLVLAAVLMTACGGASYTPGVFTETGYDSEFLGFRFTTPDGFALATEEELTELMGVTIKSMENASDLQKKYAELTNIYELMATNADGTVYGQIILEKTAVSLDTYLEVIISQLEESEQGVNITVQEGTEEVEIAGAAYTKMSAEMESYGMVFSQDYYFRKVGGRMMCMAITWMEGCEADRDALMNAFAAY